MPNLEREQSELKSTRQIEKLFVTFLATGSPNYEQIALQMTIGTSYLFDWKSRGSDSIDVDAHQFVPVFSACIIVTLAMLLIWTSGQTLE